jgi:hypothetical protein
MTKAFSRKKEKKRLLLDKNSLARHPNNCRKKVFEQKQSKNWCSFTGIKKMFPYQTLKEMFALVHKKKSFRHFITFKNNSSDKRYNRVLMVPKKTAKSS